MQFETRSRERISILPDKVACNRPSQHTTSRLHRERGMNEDEGGAIPKGTLDPKSASGCTHTDFAKQSTRST